MKKKRKGLPTKEEIQAARAKRKDGRRLQAEAWKVLRKVRRRRSYVVRLGPVSIATRDFYTWEHDVEVLARAAARSPSFDGLDADHLASLCVQAADRMKREVDARKPADYNPMMGRRQRRMGPVREWWRWQEVFDQFVHDLAERTHLDAEAVIDRSIKLADAVVDITARRRRQMRTKLAA